MSAGISVWVVSHQAFIRELLAQIIRVDGRGAVAIFGESGWAEDEIARLSAARADVAILMAGYEVRREQGAIATIRERAAACHVLVIDTGGQARRREPGNWWAADAVLTLPQVLSELLPTIHNLVEEGAGVWREPAYAYALGQARL